MHSFGDTILPRVHTASQQAHGKLKIDSVRFYTHKFLHGVGGTNQPTYHPTHSANYLPTNSHQSTHVYKQTVEFVYLGGAISAD